MAFWSDSFIIMALTFLTDTILERDFFLAKIMDDLGIDVAIPKWFKDQGILISFSLLFCIV